LTSLLGFLAVSFARGARLAERHIVALQKRVTKEERKKGRGGYE
jgi:hypothetical protein